MSTSFKAVIAGASFSFATFAATTAFAEQHSVVILGESYFPTITYLNVGDTVEFTNASGQNHEIVADDASWTSGEIGPEGSFVLAIAEGMELHFTGHDLNAEEGESEEVADSTGEFSFDTAPNL